MRFLEKLIDDCDRKVQRGKERVKKIEDEGAELNREKIAELTTQIKDTCTLIESLAEQGKVDDSQQLLAVFEALTAEKQELEKPIPRGVQQEFSSRGGQMVTI